MRLVLTRTLLNAKSTIGKLVVDDTFFCYTLEDKDRFLETHPEGKVYGETAIPRGKYQVIIDFSNRFKRELPRLLLVPGFEGIRIHPGNTDKDTHGCILVGTSIVNDDFIGNSRAAFNHLFDVMDDAYNRGEEIWIEVT